MKLLNIGYVIIIVALNQINQKQYTSEAKQKGFTKIIKLGIAFCGKEFRFVFEND